MEARIKMRGTNFLYLLVSIFSIVPLFATVDDIQGFYRPHTRYFNYYLQKSIPGTNYYWAGNRWIFKSGYQIPKRCLQCPNQNTKECNNNYYERN